MYCVVVISCCICGVVFGVCCVVVVVFWFVCLLFFCDVSHVLPLCVDVLLCLCMVCLCCVRCCALVVQLLRLLC